MEEDRIHDTGVTEENRWDAFIQHKLNVDRVLFDFVVEAADQLLNLLLEKNLLNRHKVKDILRVANTVDTLASPSESFTDLDAAPNLSHRVLEVADDFHDWIADRLYHVQRHGKLHHLEVNGCRGRIQCDCADLALAG